MIQYYRYTQIQCIRLHSPFIRDIFQGNKKCLWSFIDIDCLFNRYQMQGLLCSLFSFSFPTFIVSSGQANFILWGSIGTLHNLLVDQYYKKQVNRMLCCLGSNKKDKNDLSKKLTEPKKGKVYLSLGPEMRFQLDQMCNWAFVGNQQKKTPEQQQKQINEMKKKQSQMNDKIRRKQELNKIIQKEKQELNEQLSKLQEQNVRKRAHIEVLNYINLKQEAQIEEYRQRI